MDLYREKFQKLQQEFLEIKISAKWKFEHHHQVIYDFIMKTQKSATFTINDYTITIKIGNKDFGFKHFLLKHYGTGCVGEIKAIDILKIGNVIKNDIILPSNESNKIKFIQTKNNEKYTVILRKNKPHDLVLSFFSSL